MTDPAPLPDDWLASAPVSADLTVVRGRSALLRFRMLVVDEAGEITVPGDTSTWSAVDLSHCTISAAAIDDDGRLLLALTATGDADGWLRIVASPTDTGALTEPQVDDAWIGRWDCRVADTAGHIITPVRGRVRLLDDCASA